MRSMVLICGLGGAQVQWKIVPRVLTPETPVSPVPQNGAHFTRAPEALDWNDAERATSYDVFIDGRFVDNVKESRWQAPGLIGPNPDALNSHSWYVVAKNREGSTKCETWNFSVASTLKTPSALVEFSPSSLDFGEIKFGDSKELTFTVTNNGDSNLSGNILADCAFEVLGSSFFLGAAGTKDVTVRFSPFTPGTYKILVRLVTGSGNDVGYHVLTASGTATGNVEATGGIRITSIEPACGVPGDIVTIRGQNLGNSFGGFVPKFTSFGSQTAGGRYQSDTEILVEVPKPAPGMTGDKVQVTVSQFQGLIIEKVSNALTFQYLRPTVDVFSPPSVSQELKFTFAV